VFGPLERDGKVQVEVVPSVRAEELRLLLVAKVTRGSLVGTDRFAGSDGCVAYGFRHERMDTTTRFANGHTFYHRHRWFLLLRHRAPGQIPRHVLLLLPPSPSRSSSLATPTAINCFHAMVQALKEFVEDYA